MSKNDQLRAMREAKYARAQATAATRPAAPKRPAPIAPPAAATPAPAEESVGEALCGHRNMSGRTCTREQGHAAKSHRYS